MSGGISFDTYKELTGEDTFWTPITPDEKPTFDALLEKVEYSLKNPRSKKSEKGESLEKLMTFIYKRFVGATVHENVKTPDNQIDHEVEFNDFGAPLFIIDKVGTKFIGESKNHNDSISSREVDNLNGLLSLREVKLGIFSSYYSFSKLPNSLWANAEGKRRKLALFSQYKQVIIGFNYEDLKKISIGENYYTMMKNKYNSIISELKEDCDYTLKNPPPNQLHDSLKFLKDCAIITTQEFNSFKETITKKFGQ